MSRSIEQTGKGVEAVARAGEGQFALAGRLGGEASSEEDAAVLPDRETPAAPQSEAGHDAALQAEGPEGSSDFGEQVRAITQQIIDLMGLELSAGVTSADRYQVTIDLEGADTRIVIGKHGQTLERCSTWWA